MAAIQRKGRRRKKESEETATDHPARVAAGKYEKAISSHNRRQEWASRFLDVFRSVSAS